MKEFNLNDLVAEMQRVMRDLQKLIAVAQGEQYYEGKSCRHGHGRSRYVSNDSCVTCARGWTAAFEAKMRAKGET